MDSEDENDDDDTDTRGERWWYDAGEGIISGIMPAPLVSPDHTMNICRKPANNKCSRYSATLDSRAEHM